MAIHGKSFALLFLFVAVLSLLAAPASGENVTVTFVLVQHADFGQVFKIVGNSTELGNWEPTSVNNMTWTPGDAWAISVTLTKGVPYQYKPMVASFASGNNVCWAPDNNRDLTVPANYSKPDYVETVFWKLSCGYDCHSTTACSVTGTILDPIRQVV
ncbi:hypothetical protein SUGI_0706330 [Cryptomeria japonica]|nr:hypothetical protein SUGI_0706330 [Cryptomeria japonica]